MDSLAGIRFSIVILTCNQRDVTLRLLASLENYLDTHTDTEVIIVDNGSTDATSEALDTYKSCYGDRFSLIVNPENKGVAAGRNIGLARARGEVIMLLDNDTIVNAEALDRLRDYIVANKTCGLVAPRLVAPDGSVQASAKPFPGLGIKVLHTLAPGRESRSEQQALTHLHPFYVIGACQVFRADTLRHVGSLDENIFYGPEDADFCMRVRQLGLTIDYLKEITIVHDWQKATRRRPFSSLWRKHFCSLLYFYRKHRRAW